MVSDDTNINIGNESITRVQAKNVLGIIIDEQLKWHEHNDKQCKTISSRIGLLRRARDFVTQDVLKTMYNSLVLPHYCSTVWHNFSAEHIDKRELVITFKAQLGLVPNYLTQLFNSNNNVNHQLRSNNRSLYIPKPRTNFLKNSFSYRGRNTETRRLAPSLSLGNITVKIFR